MKKDTIVLIIFILLIAAAIVIYLTQSKKEQPPEEPQEIEDIKAEPPPTPAIPQKANCVLNGEIITSTDAEGNMLINGKIKNIGEGRATFVTIYFTIYDEYEGIVGTAMAYSEPPYFDPQQTGGFNCQTDAPFSRHTKPPIT